MVKVATKEGKMHLVREHDFLCSGAGVQTIRDDIDKEGVTHAVIAACSRRAKTEAFYFPSIALARANIREGVIWAQPDTEEARETTQEMADDYLRMGCGELKKMKLPAALPKPATPSAFWSSAAASPGSPRRWKPRDRLPGGAGGEVRQARRLVGRIAPAHAVSRTLRGTAGHRHGRTHPGGD